MLNGISQIHLLKKNQRLNQSDKPETKSVAFIVLFYVLGISEKIQRLLNELDRKVALMSMSIDNWVPFPKDRVKKDEFSRLIYHIFCADCNLIYIDLTKGNLKFE